MTQSHSAAANLSRLSQRLFNFSLGIIASVIGISLVFLLMAQQQVKRIKTLENELQSVSESQLSTAGLQQFILDNQETINELQQVFPAQDTIINFLSLTEAMVHTLDPKGTVKFSALTPTKVNDELYIPLILTFRANPSQTMQFLKQLEQLPYIIQVTTVEFKLPNSQFDQGEVVIGGKIYVQDPFYRS